MILCTLVFATQDGISRHLGEKYSIVTVVAVRFWVFAAFVLVWAALREGGVRRVARTANLPLQIARALLLVLEIWVTVLSFVLLGLIGTHAVFAVYPLLVAALAGPVLGEYVGWRRAVAIAVGLVGVLVILRPGAGVFSPLALVPFSGALMFALYALMTRMAARWDGPETSFFYIGVGGAVAMTLAAPFSWTPIEGWQDWGWMLGLSCLALLGHFLMIKAYSLAEASVIQPFAYFQLVFVGLIGVFLFGERPDGGTLAGGAIILSAGLYSLFRAARIGRRAL